MSTSGDSAYGKYLGRITITESHEKAKSFRGISLPFKYEVAKLSEEIFVQAKAKLVTIFKDHLSETKKVLEIFGQFDLLIQNTLKDQVTSLLETIRDPNEHLADLQGYICELKVFRQLIS